MQPSLEKLRKFFRLEHENGYSNSAIIGGLAKMLDYWEGEARADSIQEEVIQAVVQRLRSYDGPQPTVPRRRLKGLWKRIGETYPKRSKSRAAFRADGLQAESVAANVEGRQPMPPSPPPPTEFSQPESKSRNVTSAPRHRRVLKTRPVQRRPPRLPRSMRS